MDVLLFFTLKNCAVPVASFAVEWLGKDEIHLYINTNTNTNTYAHTCTYKTLLLLLLFTVKLKVYYYLCINDTIISMCKQIV